MANGIQINALRRTEATQYYQRLTITQMKSYLYSDKVHNYWHESILSSLLKRCASIPLPIQQALCSNGSSKSIMATATHQFYYCAQKQLTFRQGSSFHTVSTSYKSILCALLRRTHRALLLAYMIAYGHGYRKSHREIGVLVKQICLPIFQWINVFTYYSSS